MSGNAWPTPTTSADASPAPQEMPLLFDCQGETLVGVLSLPATPTRRCLIIVVGGPQYRAGSHRLFVQLARAVAAGGTAALRFDVRGMGDSSGMQRSFEAIGDDIAAAIAAAQQACPALSHFVLWGLCDGASAALMYLHSHHDPRVDGLCLANPWVRSVQTQARAQVKHYYTQRLRQKDFWHKLLTGKVALSALGGLLGSVRAALQPAASGTDADDAAASFQDRMAQGWSSFRGHTLLVMSGNDLTAREFDEYAASRPAWQGLLSRPQTQRVDLRQADHTLSRLEDKAAHVQALGRWLTALDAPAGATHGQPSADALAR